MNLLLALASSDNEEEKDPEDPLGPGRGLDHYLPTHPNPRGPVGPVGAHYSYGEGELAELSTQGRHRLTIPMVRTR